MEIPLNTTAIIRLELERDALEGILCGIMPLVNFRNAMFVRNEMSGIQVPDEIIAHYNENMSREEGEQTGITIALGIVAKQ